MTTSIGHVRKARKARYQYTTLTRQIPSHCLTRQTVTAYREVMWINAPKKTQSWLRPSGSVLTTFPSFSCMLIFAGRPRPAGERVRRGAGHPTGDPDRGAIRRSVPARGGGACRDLGLSLPRPDGRIDTRLDTRQSEWKSGFSRRPSQTGRPGLKIHSTDMTKTTVFPSLWCCILLE